jgi:hypothetical protein
MRTNYCPKCGLMYRLWIQKGEKYICDECDPKLFKEEHEKNVTNFKRRTVGQQHITENTFFPDLPSNKTNNMKKYLNRREQK